MIPGRRYSRYLIVSEIGKGGMGKVFLAEDESLGRKVALKFLHSDDEREGPSVRRFVEEARAAAAIDHPYVCKVYESGEAEGRPFIAMEYVEGESLAERLRGGPFSLVEGLRLAGEIAEALEKAHQRGVVHRDLKPSNVMLDAEGHAKVMDFGLAKRIPGLGADGDSALETASLLTVPGTILGTLAYMAPEQIRGESVDRRSDVFSFGVLLYEMLTGTHPFRKDTPGDTLAAILGADPPPAEGLPEGVTSALRDMLAKDPAQRTADLSAQVRKLAAPLAAHPSRGRSRRGWLVPAVIGGALLAGAFVIGIGWPGLLRDRFEGSPDVDAMKRGEYETRAQALMQNFSDPDDLKRSIEYWQKALDQQPDLAVALAGSANARVMIAWNSTPDPQMLDRAERDAERAIEVDPLLPDSYVALSVIYQLRGLVDTADQMSERSIQLAPDNPWALQARARFLMDRFGRFSEAEQLARRAIEIDPEFFPAWFQLGWACLELERLDEANAHFRHAIELRPNFGAGHLGLGVVLNAAHKYEEAIGSLNEALKVNPGSVQALLQRGISFHYLSEPERAMESFAAVIAGNPEHVVTPFARVFLAAEYDALGRAAERDAELRDAELVFKSNPDVGVFLLGLASVSALRGDRTQALDWLEHATGKGLRSVQMIVNNPALQSLRDEPRLQLILDDLRGS